MVKFGLRVGLSGQELWDELNHIGILGETRQEVMEFKAPQEDRAYDENIPLHNVILANNQYAIIGKSHITIDQFKHIHESWKYFLTGINDEGTYFIRPLEKLPKKINTLETVIDWINRKDEDFEKRIQGDVLVKFVNFQANETQTKQEIIQEIPNIEPNLTLVSFKTPYPQDQSFRPQINTALPRTIERRQPQHQFGRQVIGSLFSETRIQDTRIIIINGDEYRIINENPLKLGNHKLWTEGKVYVCTKKPFILVNAQSFVLQHHEHSVIEQKIPLGACAIIAAQRGRDFDLQDYLARAFD